MRLNIIYFFSVSSTVCEYHTDDTDPTEKSFKPEEMAAVLFLIACQTDGSAVIINDRSPTPVASGIAISRPVWNKTTLRVCSIYRESYPLEGDDHLSPRAVSPLLVCASLVAFCQRWEAHVRIWNGREDGEKSTREIARLFGERIVIVQPPQSVNANRVNAN